MEGGGARQGKAEPSRGRRPHQIFCMNSNLEMTMLIQRACLWQLSLCHFHSELEYTVTISLSFDIPVALVENSGRCSKNDFDEKLPFALFRNQRNKSCCEFPDVALLQAAAAHSFIVQVLSLELI
ncbi:hypothetical protein ACS0TY_007188 [Phlomoides rotata]